MWTKISSVLKRGDGDVSAAPQDPAQSSVVSLVGEQHLNHTDFRPSIEQPEANPELAAAPTHALSPPSSPSKQGKRGLFKRASKIYDKDTVSKHSLARRVKSSLHINTNMNDSNMSLTSPNGQDFVPQPVFGSVRSLFKDRKPSAMQIQAALNRSDDALNKPSSEAFRPSSPPPGTMPPPLTPIDPQRQFGSVRSILRDRNTPSSGQNVRFFSRDAYRVISPDTSVNNSSGDPHDPSFMQCISEVDPGHVDTSPNPDSTKYHSANASPNVFSPATASPNAMFLDGPPQASSTPYATSSQGMSRQGVVSMAMPAPPPQLSGIFEFSTAQEHGVHSISESEEGAHQNGAVGIDELGRVVRSSVDGSVHVLRNSIDGERGSRISSHSTVSSMSIETPNSINNDGNEKAGRRRSDEVVFHSLADESDRHPLPPRASSSLGLYKVFKRESVAVSEHRAPLDFPVASAVSSRARALSERVFSRPHLEGAKDIPETDANDGPVNDVMFSEPTIPDPFRADASNYYNSAAGFPNSPPRLSHIRSDSGVSGTSSRSASGASYQSSKSQSSLRITHNMSDEDDMVLALRTQLAFHQELSSQYELDLSTRDEHVKLLNQKVRGYEGEAEKRTKIMRGMRRKVQELERAYRSLEEQFDESRQQSFERSVMDEASGEALRELHRQINDLERDKGDVERKEQEARDENERLKEEIRKREEAFEQVKKQMEAMCSADQTVNKGLEDVRLLVTRGEHESEQERERYRTAEAVWDEERAHLVKQLEQMNTLGEQLIGREGEIDVLKQEVESQWSNTEKLTERIKELEKERDETEREREHLKEEIANLEARTSEMEVEWTENENRRADVEAELSGVWAAREEIEKECEQLRNDFEHEHAQLEDVRHALESLESQTAAIEEERQFAVDKASRLEQSLQERDADLHAYSLKVSTKEQEIDALRDELSSLRREHTRLQSEQVRSLSDLDAREANIRKQFEESIRAQTEAQMEAGGLKERVETLQGEVEKLRRQVHDLKQQSADQDVKLLQMERQHEQDNEDKLGLNIALDSKQQELELLKRKMSVRGTGGATPAAPIRAGARRESTLFKTPVPARPMSSLSDLGRRPPSSLSDTGSRSGRLTDDTPVARTTLGKSTRVNISAAPPTTVKKGRLSENSISVPLKSRPRPSEPTPTALKPSVNRTSSVRPAGGPAAAGTQHRRVVSSASLSSKSALMKSGSMSDASSVPSDKENATPRALVSRRMSMQPVPA
ncbi:hypothetical protein M0805_006990 [Coniferiporia weirii]|nr:hypothetical protein M0805_006990 [Coniferiporia weirii]